MVKLIHHFIVDLFIHVLVNTQQKRVSITLQLYYYMYVMQFEDQFVLVFYWLCHADGPLILTFLNKYAKETHQTL